MKHLSWISQSIIDKITTLRDSKNDVVQLEGVSLVEEQLQVLVKQCVARLFDRISEYVGCSSCRFKLNEGTSQSDEVRLSNLG